MNLSHCLIRAASLPGSPYDFRYSQWFPNLIISPSISLTKSPATAKVFLACFLPICVTLCRARVQFGRVKYLAMLKHSTNRRPIRYSFSCNHLESMFYLLYTYIEQRPHDFIGMLQRIDLIWPPLYFVFPFPSPWRMGLVKRDTTSPHACNFHQGTLSPIKGHGDCCRYRRNHCKRQKDPIESIASEIIVGCFVQIHCQRNTDTNTENSF